MSRRKFLSIAASAASGLLLTGLLSEVTQSTTARSKSLRLLILGGTGFLGPHYVSAALGRGHQVSVFNRGTSKAELPGSVERLFGDRNGDLTAIADRDWDAVVDLPTLIPRWVRSLGDVLKDRVKHYTFISTVAVYENPGANDITAENSRVLRYQGRDDPYLLTEVGSHYGAMKVLCEREAEAQFSGKALVLRPGYIVGPGDPQGYLTYWPERMKRAGDVLAAGDASMPVQFIDVRDLAEWSIRMIENSATGIYNVIGPSALLTFGELIGASRTVVSGVSKVAWVPAAWLATHNDAEFLWRQLLFWCSSEKGGLAHIMRMSNARALAYGLKIRPLNITLTDTLRWHERQPEDRQAQLRSALSWPDYIASEQRILAAWRHHEAGNG